MATISTFLFQVNKFSFFSLRSDEVKLQLMQENMWERMKSTKVKTEKAWLHLKAENIALIYNSL